jgi:DNA-binding response OmpR family regulator
MTRVLLIDGDRAFAQSVAMACLEANMAVRLAETLCEGVRCMLDDPVSLVLIDGALMRLSAAEQVRLFEIVAPGVPVVVLVRPGVSVEEMVKVEMQGFRAMSKSLDVRDLVAKVDLPARVRPAQAGAAARVDALCA